MSTSDKIRDFANDISDQLSVSDLSEFADIIQEVKALEKREWLLQTLEQWGVDNWSGWDETMSTLREEGYFDE